MIENLPMVGEPPWQKIFLIEEMTDDSTQSYSPVCVAADDDPIRLLVSRTFGL
jgi:hypothetical protein